MEDIIPVWPDAGDDAPGIYFTNHEVDFILPSQDQLPDWLTKAFELEGFSLNRLDFIFCTDTFLLEINRLHLGHDTYTDIITFPLNRDPVLAEIYISIDRVKENAAALGMPFSKELHRVMIHGVLHLCGYDDHDPEDIRIIRAKEEDYLNHIHGL